MGEFGDPCWGTEAEKGADHQVTLSRLSRSGRSRGTTLCLLSRAMASNSDHFCRSGTITTQVPWAFNTDFSCWSDTSPGCRVIRVSVKNSLTADSQLLQYRQGPLCLPLPSRHDRPRSPNGAVSPHPRIQRHGAHHRADSFHPGTTSWSGPSPRSPHIPDHYIRPCPIPFRSLRWPELRRHEAGLLCCLAASVSLPSPRTSQLSPPRVHRLACHPCNVLQPWTQQASSVAVPRIKLAISL